MGKPDTSASDEPPKAGELETETSRSSLRVGEVRVEVRDRRVEHRLPLDLERWGRLAGAAATDDGVAGAAELGLSFVDEGEIAELAEKYMGERYPTDVLAFPIDFANGAGEAAPLGRVESSVGPPAMIGDVVLCPAVAERQARLRKHSLAEEIALLTVHGVLHLLGHDHAEKAEAKLMRERTQSILARCERGLEPGK